ncbi:unnamed protein product, partial [Callosobruchus maculatus]
ASVTAARISDLTAILDLELFQTRIPYLRYAYLRYRIYTHSVAGGWMARHTRISIAILWRYCMRRRSRL